MQRWGLTSVAGAPSPTWGMIDNLTYNYGNWSYNPKNQLQSVTDNSGNLTKGLKTAANGSTYTYDNNGNMTADPNKAITNIAYNHLNLTTVRQVLPTTITFTNSRSITFMYDAGGNKLRKTVVQNGVTQYTQDYVGGIEYRNGALEAIYHAEGRIATINSALRYEYALKDHLGNTRLMYCDKNGDGFITQSSVQESNEVTQENHYYPYGLGMEGNWVNTPSVSDNKYTYNGKELIDDFGLGWNHHDWRFLDVAMNRFVTVDPESEEGEQKSWNPYHFGFNNPVKNSDPDGRNPILGFIIGGAVDYSFQVVKNFSEGKRGAEAFTNVNKTSIFISAVAGAATSGLSALEMSATKTILANAAVDATESVAKQATDPDNKEGITWTKTISDVASNYVAGEVTKKAGSIIDTKQLEKRADRTSRVSAGDPTSSGRTSAMMAAKSELKDANNINHASGKAAGGVVGNTIQLGSDTMRNSPSSSSPIVNKFVAPQDATRQNIKPLIIK